MRRRRRRRRGEGLGSVEKKTKKRMPNGLTYFVLPFHPHPTLALSSPSIHPSYTVIHNTHDDDDDDGHHTTIASNKMQYNPVEEWNQIKKTTTKSVSVGRSVGTLPLETKRRRQNKNPSPNWYKRRKDSLSVEMDECGKGRNNQVTIQLKKKKTKSFTTEYVMSPSHICTQMPKNRFFLLRDNWLISQRHNSSTSWRLSTH